MDVTFRKSISGFTLIELVMVIILVSIIGVYSVFNLNACTSSVFYAAIVGVGAQAYQLQSDLRYAQALSMTTGTRYYLVFTTGSGSSYQIIKEGGSAITLPNGGTTYTLTTRANIASATNLPNNLVAFDGRGIPYTTSSSPGTALTSAAVITVQFGADSSSPITVTVAPYTGRISIP